MTIENLDLSGRRYSGGMRIIEALQQGVDIAETLNEIARGMATPGGAEEYAGAVESVLTQFVTLRNAGLKVTRKNGFLHRPPFFMAGELTRQLAGGAATLREFEANLSGMVAFVSEHRLRLTHKGRRLALR